MLKKVFVVNDADGNELMSFILDSSKILDKTEGCKFLNESGTPSDIDTIKIYDESNNQVCEFDVDSNLKVTRCENCCEISQHKKDYRFQTEYELVVIKQSFDEYE